MKKILIPGTFDPVTRGHLDLVERCADIFDEVHVVVFENSEKKGKTRFTPEQRLEMLIIAMADMENVIVDRTDMMVIEYAAENGLDAIVKGVRNTLDFEYEYDLSVVNKSLSGIETFFVPTRPEYRHISSTVAREMIKYGKSVSEYIPAKVEAYLKKNGVL